MSLADKAIEAMNEIVFDAHPGFNAEINEVYEALQKLKEYEQEAAARSWQGCVDRQSGAFDSEETDPMRGWK